MNLRTVLVMCACAVTLSQASSINVTQRWEDRFSGRFCLTAPFDIYAGWQIKLNFTKEVTDIQIWVAQYYNTSTDGSGSEIIVINRDYNQMWKKKEQKCIGFLGTTTSSTDAKFVEGTAAFTGLKAPEICKPRKTGQGLKIKKLNQWSGGLQANVCLTVPQKMNGWTIRLTFSKRIPDLDIWDAESIKLNRSGRVYILTNLERNRMLVGGDRFCFTFLAYTYGNLINPCIDAYFVGKDGKTPVTPTITTKTPLSTVVTTSVEPDPASSTEPTAPDTVNNATQNELNEEQVALVPALPFV